MGCCNSFIQCLLGKREDDEGEKKIVRVEGTVVLMKKDVLGFNDFVANMLDDGHELLHKGVSFQLVSATVGDPNRGKRGKVGEEASLEHWITPLPSRTAGEFHFKVHFEWDPQALGVPGAVIVRNHHHYEFYLKTITLEGEPRLHFVCNSWVYPTHNYDYDRVFFANHTYLPSKMPEPLRQYQEEEFHRLRGDNVHRELQPYDRIYGYDFYNDLGNPDHKPEDARPVLGGSKEHPYPRRGRTGRPPTKKDPKCESKVPLPHLIYVPSDERFGHLKLSDFVAYALKAVEQSLVPLLRTVFDKTPFEFDTYDDVLKLYGDGLKLPDSPALNEAKDRIPIELIKELLRTDGEHLLKLPLPQVIQDNTSAWRTDEEFGREMLAGVNPVIIRLLKEFPPTSTLDPNEYGDHTSSITADHIAQNLEGLTVDTALANKKLFILDHHDSLIPYLNRINNETPNKIYASRTLLLLKSDGTLKPLAIELSLPRPAGEQPGVNNWVFTPAEGGVEGSVWHLAKAYAAVNDSGVHQLISHWLNTHAAMEPFVIATNRKLSIVHPIHKLLKPHYRDTMNINGIARQVLINADGILEKTVFPGKFAMEMSSAIYRNWKFTEQGLPDDLLKRGVAVEDPASATKIRLLIEDYPFAVDGLAIWSAVETWVEDYCSIYYPTDATVRADTELQAWWKEVREVGHGDLSDQTWWPEMKTVAELTKSCTTIIWVASALHAAVNFGQYPYAGYLPNRPTISRKFMPERGTADYERLKQNHEKVFLETITSQFQTILGVSLIEILSRHSSDEVYLGQRDTPEWTSDQRALEAFRRFSERLVEIECRIVSMNQDEKLKNRNGPVKMPYTLLYPNTSATSTQATGLTGRGIPNSVSI